MLVFSRIDRTRSSVLMRINVHRTNGGSLLSRNSPNTPTVDTVDRSSSGAKGAPLAPFDERAPTSLELLRQLEDFVRELLDPPRS